jgi:hypothetical protein
MIQCLHIENTPPLTDSQIWQIINKDDAKHASLKGVPSTDVFGRFHSSLWKYESIIAFSYDRYYFSISLHYHCFDFDFLALPYMSIMSPTPKASLSAVIISAVVQSVYMPQALMQLKVLDFFTGWATGIITSVTSPTLGIGIGLTIFFALSPFNSKKEKKE